MEGLNRFVSEMFGARVIRQHTNRTRRALEQTNQCKALFVRKAVGKASEPLHRCLAVLFCEIDHLANKVVGFELGNSTREVELFESLDNFTGRR